MKEELALLLANSLGVFHDFDEWGSNVTIIHLIIYYIHYDSFMTAIQVYIRSARCKFVINAE